MKIRINGKLIDEILPSDVVHSEIQETENMIKQCNRRTRRSKPVKLIATLLTILSGLAMTTVAHAEASEPIEAGETPERQVPFSIGGLLKEWALNRINSMPDQLGREDSIMWQMNEYMSHVLLKTYDFFTNPAILNLHHSISAITLSFTTVIIAKKGFDMIKAKMMGASTLGLPELLVRLVCSLVIMFLSLKVGSLGIALSNTLVQTFFGKIIEGFVPTETVLKGVLGTFFWLITYILLFAILGLRYWVRQINIVFLGLLSPVASLAWVSDGGAMLNNLIKEFIVYLSTPLAQGAVLTVGTIMLTEVAANFVGFGGILSQVLIGISTLFVAVVTPDILKKFIQGSANPFSFALKTAMQLKSFPLLAKGLLTK